MCFKLVLVSRINYSYLYGQLCRRPCGNVVPAVGSKIYDKTDQYNLCCFLTKPNDDTSNVRLFSFVCSDTHAASLVQSVS